MTDKTNPNAIARAEIANMPSLAGKEPRTIFHLDMVVPSDLKGCGFTRPSEEPINTTLGGFESQPGIVHEQKSRFLNWD